MQFGLYEYIYYGALGKWFKPIDFLSIIRRFESHTPFQYAIIVFNVAQQVANLLVRVQLPLVAF